MNTEECKKKLTNEQRKAQDFIERNQRWFHDRTWHQSVDWPTKLDVYNQRLRNLRRGR